MLAPVNDHVYADRLGTSLHESKAAVVIKCEHFKVGEFSVACCQHPDIVPYMGCATGIVSIGFFKLYPLPAHDLAFFAHADDPHHSWTTTFPGKEPDA